METTEFKARTHAELLPTPELAEKWVSILMGKRQELDTAKRECQFLFGHGWLVGLVDAGVLSFTARDELRELLIATKP